MKKKICGPSIYLSLVCLLALNSCGTQPNEAPATITAVGDWCSVRTPRCLFSGIVAKNKAGELYCKIRHDKPMACK